MSNGLSRWIDVWELNRKYESLPTPTPRVSVCTDVNQSRVQPCKHTSPANLAQTVKGVWGEGEQFCSQTNDITLAWKLFFIIIKGVLGVCSKQVKKEIRRSNIFCNGANEENVSFAWSKRKLSLIGKISATFAIKCQLKGVSPVNPDLLILHPKQDFVG